MRHCETNVRPMWFLHCHDTTSCPEETCFLHSLWDVYASVVYHCFSSFLDVSLSLFVCASLFLSVSFPVLFPCLTYFSLSLSVPLSLSLYISLFLCLLGFLCFSCCSVFLRVSQCFSEKGRKGCGGELLTDRDFSPNLNVGVRGGTKTFEDLNLCFLIVISIL